MMTLPVNLKGLCVSMCERCLVGMGPKAGVLTHCVRYFAAGRAWECCKCGLQGCVRVKTSHTKCTIAICNGTTDCSCVLRDGALGVEGIHEGVAILVQGGMLKRLPPQESVHVYIEPASVPLTVGVAGPDRRDCGGHGIQSH